VITALDENSTISGDEITAVLQGFGNRLLFIDACHSGGLNSDRMIRVLQESNAFVFSSSQHNELSWENQQAKQGYFTNSIMTALRGNAAAALTEGNVSMRSMTGFVSIDVYNQVMRDIRESQKPRLDSLSNADFPLAVIRQ
jgi:uncharacterized caspase-like protein